MVKLIDKNGNEILSELKPIIVENGTKTYTKNLVSGSTSSAITEFTAPRKGVLLVNIKGDFPAGSYRKIIEIKKNLETVCRHDSNINLTVNDQNSFLGAIYLEKDDVEIETAFQASGTSKSINFNLTKIFYPLQD